MLLSSKKITALRAGQRSEVIAREYLESQGLSYLASNVRYPFGELDLIMREQTNIIFVEVKYRRTKQYGGAIQSLSHKQAQRLQSAATAWLQHYDPKANLGCRFDLVAITGHLTATDCVWVKNIFQ